MRYALGQDVLKLEDDSHDVLQAEHPLNAAVPCQDGGTVRHTAHAVGIPCPFPVTRPRLALRGHAPFFSGALSCRASPFRARHLPYLGAPP